jgi:hypothetical protein
MSIRVGGHPLLPPSSRVEEGVACTVWKSLRRDQIPSVSSKVWAGRWRVLRRQVRASRIVFPVFLSAHRKALTHASFLDLYGDALPSPPACPFV